MTTPDTDKVRFLEAVQSSLADQSFVRVTLGKSRGEGVANKSVMTPVAIQEDMRLRIVESYPTKDITTVKTVTEAVVDLARTLGNSYLSATLFTTEHDVALIYNKKLEARLTKGKPTFSAPPSTSHNRAKETLVDPSRHYLKALGVTLDDGRVKPSMYPKFKQINHFIEIIDDILRSSPLQAATNIAAIDIGAGKGYLTFALYDFLTARLGKICQLTGIEMRPDLVKQGNDLAARSRFSGLSFQAALAASTEIAPLDLMIALHACDTATDDAIFHGIAANAAVIICAPCCQHEIAPQLSHPDVALRGLTKYGLFKQRQSDLITDAARALLMEASGYKVKIIEFVSTEHTSKNLLITGVKSETVDRAFAQRQYDALKAFANFETHRLEQRLSELRKQI